MDLRGSRSANVKPEINSDFLDSHRNTQLDQGSVQSLDTFHPSTSKLDDEGEPKFFKFANIKVICRIAIFVCSVATYITLTYFISMSNEATKWVTLVCGSLSFEFIGWLLSFIYTRFLSRLTLTRLYFIEFYGVCLKNGLHLIVWTSLSLGLLSSSWIHSKISLWTNIHIAG